MARSNGPLRCSFCLRGIVTRIPRRWQYRRILPLLYPLSPTTRWGRCFGRPRPTRLTAPHSISDSKTLASCCCPGVSSRAISLPFPSARRWTFVPKPPWLRPSASLCGSPLLPLPHADVPSRQCHRYSELASSLGLERLRLLGYQPEADPRPLPCASGRSGWPPSAKGHSVLANHAKVHLCAESIGFRSRFAGDRPPVGPSLVSGVAAVAAAAPIVHCSIPLGSYRGSCNTNAFANTP